MANDNIKSIRPFIGARSYSISREFYRVLGFAEVVVDAKMSWFSREGFGFYLQDAYVKDWINNTMIFLEVENVEEWLKAVKSLNLPDRFPGARCSEIVVNDWGCEFFLHDPSGILWHFGKFK